MTSRMHAPHTTCPGCQEEVFLDELVGGKCPLCGCSLEDFEEAVGEYDGILDRSDLSWLIFNYFVFKKFVDLGVPPSQIMDFLSSYEQDAEKPRAEGTKTGFSLELPMGITDRIRPKRCAKCHRLFVRGGHKQIVGDMQSTVVGIQYVCDRC
ncbi:hypothetical protein [Methanoregula sp.]|uniref:hypothetical protein n=1 Tax=Methanoregula sp. TaxID=2052170 RepID=UPI002C295A54|nr:hypothetical protein [Methanoregula sp.]HVP97155.1 hypothetical protein [Methanoregula sp.]